MGHVLHHMLSEVPVKYLSGTHVAWDFVEATVSNNGKLVLAT